MAAWYRKVDRACRCLFGTPFAFGGLPLAMSGGLTVHCLAPACRSLQSVAAVKHAEAD